MTKSDQSTRLGQPQPDFLVQLEQSFGWSERQALEALGEYLMSTEAGQALRRELEPRNQTSRAA